MKPFHLVVALVLLSASSVACGGATSGDVAAIVNMMPDAGLTIPYPNVDSGMSSSADSPSTLPNVDSGADVPTVGDDAGSDVATTDPPDAPPDSPGVDAGADSTPPDGGGYCFSYPAPVPSNITNAGITCQGTSNPGIATCCCPFPANTHTYSSTLLNDLCNPN